MTEDNKEYLEAVNAYEKSKFKKIGIEYNEAVKLASVSSNMKPFNYELFLKNLFINSYIGNKK